LRERGFFDKLTDKLSVVFQQVSRRFEKCLMQSSSLALAPEVLSADDSGFPGFECPTCRAKHTSNNPTLIYAETKCQVCYENDNAVVLDCKHALCPKCFEYLRNKSVAASVQAASSNIIDDIEANEWDHVMFPFAEHAIGTVYLPGEWPMYEEVPFTYMGRKPLHPNMLNIKQTKLRMRRALKNVERFSVSFNLVADLMFYLNPNEIYIRDEISALIPAFRDDFVRAHTRGVLSGNIRIVISTISAEDMTHMEAISNIFDQITDDKTTDGKTWCANGEHLVNSTEHWSDIFPTWRGCKTCTNETHLYNAGMICEECYNNNAVETCRHGVNRIF